VRLEVHGVERGGMLDTTGTVTFTAHFREGLRDGRLSEVSRFVRHEGAWVYVDPAEAGLLTEGPDGPEG